MDLPFYIENRDSFRVVGYLMKTTNQKGQGRKEIPLHWSNFRKDNLETRMLALAEQKLMDYSALISIIRIWRIPGNSSI